MAYWLADARRHQESGVVKRFSPPFWTVDFPRPMMASVVTQGADGLRIDAVFHGSGDLAGLIWESEDRWDHPLLRYETRRDHGGCRLSFRWRSEGMKPLDAVHGPTLTIEGRDASGAPRAWYVRLWNYATGDPEDARITLDFDALNGGFLLPDEADAVHPGDIDRMFISLVPQAYDAGDTLFPEAAEAWVEISDMRCDGPGSVLAIGDIMVPEHGLSIATGYDDAYNQTPERLLRQALALGYRGAINHYVGMSHYMRLAPVSDGFEASLAGGALATPCARWLADFAARCVALGFGLILSLSYELFDAYCPAAWKQRAWDGAPALTGWVPPSTLLSPAHDGATAYLAAVARAFVAIARDAGLAVRFQIGEPWWWIMPDGRPCLYDDAARLALGGAPPDIPTVRGPLDAAQIALLDEAGALLAASTAAVREAVLDEAIEAETLLLVYLPSVLDPAAPELKRANLPVGWAAPAFDRLQIEDYDWVTEGRVALSAAGRAAMNARLGYPPGAQHYLAGFVPAGLTADETATAWSRIAAAAEAAMERGHAATFIWALPQVARDGFTFFDLQGDADVQAFDDIAFPLDIGRRAQVAPTFSTRVVESVSGHEQRSTQWADARLHFDAGPGVRSEADIATLIAFFRARRGAARGFRFRDPFDCTSAPAEDMASATDQSLGTGDGTTAHFRLLKRYGEGPDAQVRFITRPEEGTIRVALDSVEQAAGWHHAGLGLIAFETAPAAGTSVTAGFLFDVPVRFAEDRLDIDRETFAAGAVPSVPLVEIRE
ncbi:hypothetical protein SLG_33130 [Sphingobium sp. SYK-6]|uniref:DUF2460 domain-containing protein n=1 Tax=Sphingobium sp. (strain NBRC 103272 / SYK-6) TaxID=627192 RepID=UPI0002276FBB|nr:DUF2460 domain-containing protein [Sphingobium sp. SYK-6]BAK67988.1 hypothetical protein SLG_33130 [Sphingobium sp. SYK-6]